MEEKLEKKPTEPETQDSKVQDEDLDGVAGWRDPPFIGKTVQYFSLLLQLILFFGNIRI